MSKKLIGLLIITILILSGCGKKSANYDSSPGNNVKRSSLSVSSEQEKASVENQIRDKKIIIHSSIILIVDDIQTASESITKKTTEFGGYMEKEDVYESSAYSVARIPAEKTEDFIKYIEDNFKTKNKNTSREDITEAYVDNDARIRNLRAEENQIVEILKKADTVEDILRVQNELFRIRGEIESLESMKKLWDNQTGYSTITLNLEKKGIVSNSKISIMGAGDFFKAITTGFVNSVVGFVYAIQKFIIFIISNIVTFIILSALIYLIVRLVKKQNKHQATKEIEKKQ